MSRCFEVNTLTGIDLDIAIAEHIMGWTWEEDEEDGPYLIGPRLSDGTHRCYWPQRRHPANLRRVGHELPPYSTYIEFAWEVVDRIATPGAFRLSYGSSGMWWASFTGPAVQGSSPAEAICRAALMEVNRE
jgi:hypothetical protein